MPKHVTSGGGGPRLRSLAPGQRYDEKTSLRWRTVGDTVSDLIGPKIYSQTWARKSGGRKDFLGSLKEVFQTKKVRKAVSY